MFLKLVPETLSETGSPKFNDISVASQQAEPMSDYDHSTVLVQFRSGLSDGDRDRVIAGFDGAIQRRFRLIPGRAEVRVGTRVGDALSVFRASKDVIVAEPNYRFQVADVPNDPSFSKQWSLESPTAVHIDATRAWGLHKGSHSLKIAVLDTGIDRTHPEFSDNIWSNPLEVAGDGIDNDANGYIDGTNGWDFTLNAPGVNRSNGDNDPTDGHGHGTHVSGIIAAQGNNATGVTGICWDAAIVPLKVAGNDGSGLTSWMIAAVEYCVRNGIPVANASIGGANYSGYCKAAIDAAGIQGYLLFVAAAGNNGSDNDGTPFYPETYDCPNIVSMASITSSGAMSSFSNRGIASVDIAAPGSSITSTYPLGKSVSGYTTLSGTSMAAPMVAAVAGLL
ncbi:MAG: S8 family peptidase [Armatimonadota bacterium]